MTTIPTNRTTANSPSEHVSDHNILHHFNNEHPTDPSAHLGTNVASTAAGEVTAVTVQGAIENLAGGANVSPARLKDWTQAEAYEPTSITRDSNEVVTTATVKWPDGSGGTFTATTINATFLAIDAFTVTHTLSGKTVTQTAVTRDSGGGVTVKPALTVA